MERRELLATFSVTNTADSGVGSLRAAMTAANARIGSDDIRFGIPASTAANLDVPVPGFDPATQSWRIALASPLPTITDPVTIDGTTQAFFPVPYRYPQEVLLNEDPTLIASTSNTRLAVKGNDAVNRVIIDGSQTNDSTGFVIATSHSIIRGLNITGFGVGILVPRPEHVGNLIQANSIGGYFLFNADPFTGEDLTGAARTSFVFAGNSRQGIVLDSTNTTVGGVAPAEANVITGNGLQGVAIIRGAEGNQVIGNQIGMAGPTVNDLFVTFGNGDDGVLVGATGILAGNPTGPIGDPDDPIGASSNYVGGTAAGAGNLISANAGHGVHIVGGASTRVIIKGNSIGNAPGGGAPVEPRGGLIFGAGETGNLGDGIRIEDAGSNQVGGTEDSDRNYISANEGAGVRIFGANATGNVVRGNIIGLTSDGVSPLGNSLEGVVIASAGNVVGPGNVISANLRGVLLSPGASRNVIRDNLIGTDSLGVSDVGNAREGVRIEGASDNVISGDSTGSQVISGNNMGVFILGPSAARNQVLGTLIGTDIRGLSDIGNSQEGIRIEDSPSNSIGGVAMTDRNLISANHWGVVLSGASTFLNLIRGNYIGTDITGEQPPGNGNELDGVLIRRGAFANTVGGPSVEAGNAIAFNVRDGVRIEDDDSIRNAILTNRIFANGGLGINLVGSVGEPTVNDPSDSDLGPNMLQNSPTIEGVASSIAFTNIQGSLVSTPNTAFVIQFFANSLLDPTGEGEGGIYLGQTIVTTDAGGGIRFSADVPATVAAGRFVTATATDPLGNTSEFSGPLDEELGEVRFSMASYTIGESGGAATILVTRSGGSGGRFTVDYATSGGTALSGIDYVPTSGTLTFEAGQATASFTVTILGDTEPEADETIFLTLSNPAGAAMLGTPAAAVLTILDDDQPGALSFLTMTFVVDESAGMALITVVRDGGGGLVSVDYSTSNGSALAGIDYAPVSGTLVFNPGETAQTFAVPIVLDASVEGDETVILNLANPTGGATLGAPSSAVLVILDDRVDRSGPRVAGVRAISGAVGVASVLIAFDEPLDPARAVDFLNYGYSVRTPGRDGRFGTRDDLLIGLRSAIYDPATRTVSLFLAKSVSKKTPLRLSINQVTDIIGLNKGVSDLAGNLLDGNGDGIPGGAYSATVVARPSVSLSATVPHPSKPKAEAKTPKVGPNKIATKPAPAKGRIAVRPAASFPRS